MSLTKRFLAVFFTGLLMFSGVAMAAPPEEDPTCRGEGEEQECPGDNGDAGCEGINRARERVSGTPGEDALELVVDILDDGPEGEDCDSSERPGGRP